MLTAIFLLCLCCFAPNILQLMRLNLFPEIFLFDMKLDYSTWGKPEYNLPHRQNYFQRINNLYNR
ncbi:hypothetical protein NIES4101_83050 [Calothrix sp. NIES-4101]|nr:hypothetical protein NIES4101_83050 [Calothrix sp. NIES-4101]